MSERLPETTRPYTAEEIYDLATGLGNVSEKLARAFDSLPYNLDGVAIHDRAVRTSDEGDRDDVVCFNGQLSEDEQAVLRKKSGERLIPKGKSYISLGSEQKEAKEKIKPGTARFIGRLTTSGSVAGSSGYELVALSGDVALGSTAGLAAFGIVYGVARNRHRQHERKQATQFIKGVHERFFDRAQGCVSLLKGTAHTISLGDPEANDPESSEKFAYFVKLRGNPVYARSLRSKPFPMLSVDVQPLKLVQGALERDEAPLDFWLSGFGDKAKELSIAEQNVMKAKRALKAAKDRAEFTGVTLQDELDNLDEAHKEAQAELLDATISTVQFCEKRRICLEETERINKAEEAINAILHTDEAEPHQFEMLVQTFTSIACRSLGRLELSDENTHMTVKSLAHYLQGTRERLKKPEQIEQFYRGLYAQFAEQLPGLPEWEEVKDQFATTDTL